MVPAPATFAVAAPYNAVFDLVINIKSAEARGFDIAATLLSFANKVIE